jgi:hypothetical protein
MGAQDLLLLRATPESRGRLPPERLLGHRRTDDAAPINSVRG